LSSGRTKPRSPAKPQQSTSSGTVTAVLQRPAIASSLSTLPILRTLHTGCTATASGCAVTARRASTTSCTNSMLSCMGRRPASDFRIR